MMIIVTSSAVVTAVAPTISGGPDGRNRRSGRNAARTNSRAPNDMATGASQTVRSSGAQPATTGTVHKITVRPLVTVLIGVVGGVIVGMTSVGSGSLMIVGLLFIYPTIGANQLVGTDLTQAVPLTLAAALGALIFGHVEISVTGSLIIGSVPAVLVGSLLSSTIPDRFVRPAIAFVIYASGLKYIGLATTTLGWVLCATLLLIAVLWLVFARPWQLQKPSASPADVSAHRPQSERPVGVRD